MGHDLLPSLLSTLSGVISSMRHFAPLASPSGPKEKLDPTKVFLPLFPPRPKERERDRVQIPTTTGKRVTQSNSPLSFCTISLSSLCLLPSFRPFTRTWLKHRRRRDSRESGGRGPFFTSSFSLSVPFFFFPSFSSPKREKGFLGMAKRQWEEGVRERKEASCSPFYTSAP